MSNQHHIRLNEQAFLLMQQDALSTFPNECCGFFYGDDSGNIRDILLAKEVVNSQAGDQRRRFEIAPFDYMKAEQYALKNNLTLLGIYHSHPNHPSVPSIHDLQKALPYFSYIIISVNEGQFNTLQSWRLNEQIGQFEEEQVHYSTSNALLL
jgi:proteasome lid subunit RPN8/RPN11